MLTPDRVRAMIAEAQKSGAPPPAEAIGIVALLTYLDGESDELIGRRFGISRRTMSRWKQRPEFTAARAAIIAMADIQMRLQLGVGYDFPGWSKEIPRPALERMAGESPH